MRLRVTLVNNHNMVHNLKTLMKKKLQKKKKNNNNNKKKNK